MPPRNDRAPHQAVSTGLLRDTVCIRAFMPLLSSRMCDTCHLRLRLGRDVRRIKRLDDFYELLHILLPNYKRSSRKYKSKLKSKSTNKD